MVVRRQLDISLLTPDLSGGGMTRAYWLAKVLKRLGHRVVIFGRLRKGKSIYPLPPEGLPIRPIESVHDFHLTRTLLKELNGDVVYAIKPRFSSFGIGLLWRCRTGRPVVLDIDDWECALASRSQNQPGISGSRWGPLAGSRTWLKGLFNTNHRRYVRLLKPLVPRANAITVNSRFLQHQFGGQYVPSGKDTSLFDPCRFDPEESRKRLKLAGHTVVMFPGTPLPHKGLEDLLRAVELLGMPDMKVVLVGGRQTDFAQTLLKRWPRWTVHLPRFPLDAMPEVVAAAHVVAIPQRDTPQARAQVPMKLTDAMAMAKPIVSTTVGDIPEILSDTGFLVEPSRPDRIAQQLEWILSHPREATRKSWEARKRCVEYFSLNAVQPLLANVIDTLDCRSRLAEWKL